MPIKLQGKDYKLVAERLSAFLEKYGGNWSINTELVAYDTESVIMKAIIRDRNSGDVAATGHAQNYCGDKDKVLEKTETTAIGRALAVFDRDLMGTDIASADEIATWMQHGNDQKLLEHMETVRAEWPSIVDIKGQLRIALDKREQDEDDWPHLSYALESWRELGEDVMRVLWRAPSKGGIFTTLERKLLDEASAEDHRMRKDGGNQ
jgi:hypothetical protein